MMPGWLLPIAEKCTEARELEKARASLVTDERRQMWRECFQAGVMALREPEKAPVYMGIHRALLLRLPRPLALAVSEAVSDHVDEVRKGCIPTIHRFAYAVTMDVDGVAPNRGDVAFGSRPDCLWNETAATGEQTAVVLQHELTTGSGAPAEFAWPSLEALGTGLAWAVMNDLERVRVGRCVHAVNKPPRYEWTKPMGDSEMQIILARVRRALTAPRAAVVGMRCYYCPAARVCPAWQLPALSEGHQALKPVMQHGEGITKQNVEHVRRVALAMDNAARAALFQIREYELAQGTANDNGHPDETARYIPALMGTRLS